MKITVGRPKDLEKRKQILVSARSVFLKSGYHGSSMNQIAKEAGVTKLTVYNHFQDKENLFSCAIEQTCEESLQAQPFKLHAGCNFNHAFFQACEMSLKVIYLPEALKLEHLLFELAAEKNPLVLQFYNVSHTRMRLLWEDFFKEAVALKHIKNGEIEQQIILILSLLLGTQHYEVLLGVREVPTTQERHQIIFSSIQLFLMKYQVSAKETAVKSEDLTT